MDMNEVVKFFIEGEVVMGSRYYGEFDNIYNHILSIVDIEKVKKQHTRNMIRSILIYLSIIMISIYPITAIILAIALDGALKNEMLFPFYLVFYIGICLIAIVLKFFKKTDAKNNVIEKLLTAINSNIVYDNGKKSFNAFYPYENKYAEFFENYIPNYSESNNIITINFNNNTLVEIANTLLEYYRPRQHSLMYGPRKVFYGTTVKVTRDKVVSNRILISKNNFNLKDKLNYFLYVFPNNVYRNKGNKVLKTPYKITKSNKIMCTNEFESKFALYALNTTDAEIMISEYVQSELIKLYKEYGIMFEITLKDNYIYIRFHNGGLFNNNTFISPLQKDMLFKYYIDFKNIVEIIDRICTIF